MGKYLLALTGLLILVGLFVPKLSSLYCIKTTGEEGWCSFMLPLVVYVLFFLIWIFSAIFLFVINRSKTKDASEKKINFTLRNDNWFHHHSSVRFHFR